MSDSLLVIFPLVVLYAVTAGRRFGQLSVISLFIYAQATMAAGTLPVLDPSLAADIMHATVIILSLVAMIGVSIVYSFATLKRTRSVYDPEVDFSYPKRPVTILILISIAVSGLYYMSIGYLAFFESLQALVADSGEDIAGLRLESYAGSRYFYPGYVNQFKNALLPALTIVVIASAYHFRRAPRHLLALVLVPITLVCLLGTGQRGAFVLALGLAAISAYLIAPKRVHKFITPIVVLGVGLFFLTTVATGRAAQDLTDADGIGGQVGVLFEQLAFRILGSNQTSSVVGFRYIYDQQVPLGSEWWESFVGLLPGQTGSDLSNQIFSILYGSTRGTAPLSLWGSAYHNLGLIGVLIFALLLALILCRLSQGSVASTSTNLIQVVGIAGVTVSIATWIADGPVAILNTGTVMYALLWIWGRSIEKRSAKSRELIEPTARPS